MLNCYSLCFRRRAPDTLRIHRLVTRAHREFEQRKRSLVGAVDDALARELRRYTKRARIASAKVTTGVERAEEHLKKEAAEVQFLGARASKAAAELSSRNARAKKAIAESEQHAQRTRDQIAALDKAAAGRTPAYPPPTHPAAHFLCCVAALYTFRKATTLIIVLACAVVTHRQARV